MKQKKIIRNLIHFASNEEAGLKKVRVLKRISKIGGWTVLLAVFFLAFQQPLPLPAWTLVFAAAMGGAMLGLGMWFENTMLTWPTLRQFVDLERLRNYESS